MASATDLREGFVWLIAALATPGIFLPLYMYFRWAEVAAVKGVAVMQARVLLDKIIYLDLTFVGVALLTAVVWQSLLIERRDALILGTLPVRPRAIIGGKMAALLVYSTVVAVGMHLAGTLLYGLGLSSLVDASMLFRFLAGQMAAAVGANIFVFAIVIGLQSLTIALLGPRRFSRLSSVLQIIVVAATTMMLLFLPALMSAAEDMPRWTAETRNALMWLPPFWFLGLNEVISGSSFAVMPVLADRAILALTLATALVVVTYPIAAWRVMTASVLGGSSARPGWTRVLTNRLVRAIGHNPHERSIAQFMLAAIARAHQQRLILAVACGVAITMLAPALLMYVDGANIDTFDRYWSDHGPFAQLRVLHVLAHYSNFDTPPVSLSLVSAPLLLNVAVVWGLRVAISIPSDLQAAWPFAVSPAPMFAGRNAVRRLMVLVGVIMPLSAIAPVWLMTYGWSHTWPLLVACTLGMLAMVDGTLWGFVGIPCAKPMSASRSNLMSRWPLLLLLVYFQTYVFPSFQVGFTLKPGPVYMLIPPLLIWWFVRRGSASAAYANGVSGDPHGYIVLDLVTVRARRTADAR